MARRIDTAVILAAGRGIRLGDRTKRMPKGFLELGGETLIARSIRLLRRNGIGRIVIGTGHEAEAYEAIRDQHDLTLYRSDAYETTESLYTLACAAPHVDGPLLILESDLLYDDGALPAVLASPHENVILGSGFTGAGDEVYLHALDSGRFRYLSKDRNDRANAYAELVGISKVSRNLFGRMVGLPTVRQTPYEYAFNVLSAREEIRVARQSDLVWCEIDDEGHLARAVSEILPRLSH
jgi:2-aminoethylphosphonate-pyruvate transaminase